MNVKNNNISSKDQKKTKSKRSGLGKGLSAILKDNSIDESTIKSDFAPGSIIEIPVNQISANPWQPRDDFDEEALKELADSIENHGIIQPVSLRRLNDNNYQLISGERRFQAIKILKRKTIAAYVRSANDQQMLEMALIENLLREDLNPIEIALGFQRLISECHLTQEGVGIQVGKKRATITNFLRLLRLPPNIQSALKNQELSMGHAKVILSLQNVDMQLDCFQEIIAKNLSVRDAEKLAKSYSEAKMNPVTDKGSGNDKLNPQTKSVINDLSSRFGTKIQLKINKNNKGEIKIPFMSVEDLNRILDIIYEG